MYMIKSTLLCMKFSAEIDILRQIIHHIRKIIYITILHKTR